MKLLFFGRLRDGFGTHMLDLELPPEIRDSDQLRAWLSEQYAVELGPEVKVAIDNALVSEARPLGGIGEVAFLPAVSGG